MQHGSYTYESPEGQIITVTYTADENGFRATGDHIPTEPPLSPQIQESLRLINAGIEAKKARDLQRSQTDPEFAKSQAARDEANYLGQYIPEYYN